MFLFTYRKVVKRPIPTAKPGKGRETRWHAFLCSQLWWHCFLHSCLPRACWITSLAHSMTRKGRLFWSQRKRQRSSEREALGSPESRSGSGGSSSGSELEGGARLCACECVWLWELILHLLDDAPPLDSPGPPVMGTRTSLLSGLEAAAPLTGALAKSSGCRVRDKPFPAWPPRSVELGCITVGDSLSFSTLLESVLRHKSLGQSVSRCSYDHGHVYVSTDRENRRKDVNKVLRSNEGFSTVYAKTAETPLWQYCGTLGHECDWRSAFLGWLKFTKVNYSDIISI